MLRVLLQRLQGAVCAEAAADRPLARTVPGANDDARRTTLEISKQLCAVTDIGRTRDHNEDLVHVSDDGRVMILADGMGGHAAGEVASALAVAAITEHLHTALYGLIDASSDALALAMRAAMDAAQQRVLAAAASPEGKPGMGCTLVLACIRDDVLQTCHVGDVRAYLWREGEFGTLTRDHSVVAEMVAAGVLTPDQARGHSAKNEVLRAIGMPAGFEPDSKRCALQPGDRVILCSDGLWEMLSDRDIARVVGADGSMRQLATQLIDRANDAGGHDNVSVVLYQHCVPLQSTGAQSG